MAIEAAPTQLRLRIRFTVFADHVGHTSPRSGPPGESQLTSTPFLSSGWRREGHPRFGRRRLSRDGRFWRRGRSGETRRRDPDRVDGELAGTFPPLPQAAFPAISFNRRISALNALCEGSK